MPQPLTIKAKAERFPPIACRLLARKRTRHRIEAMSDDEIRNASGLSMSAVKRLSWALSWRGVDLYEMLAFSRACGIDFDDRRSLKQHTLFLKRGNWTHITRSPECGPLFMPLYNEWQRSQGRS